ncbi:MAG: type II secretion system F family protein [Alphaproteobacteria bacterium]|nr:type II secretion system F family protein [Alphaproteobacteria bacterium]
MTDFISNAASPALYAAVLLLAFLSMMLLIMSLGNLAVTWSAVRRRVVSETARAAGPGRDQPNSPVVIERETARGLNILMPQGEGERSALRRFLNLAGYRGANAPVIYQSVRTGLAVLFGLLTIFYSNLLFPRVPFFAVAPVIVLMVLLGFMLPRTIVSLRRDSLMEEHRIGFPDFLDLLVICVEAGIGIEAAIARVSEELERIFPSLAFNLKLMSNELRAGRNTREALDSLSQRLGIPEGKSFALLVQQSEELGSSLVHTLRVYSEEMRLKRFARAEEKAQALPVKLVFPLGLFCFPAILGITLFPVAIKLFKALGI